jgi:predicted short-subunit dehydrogenase-like oxidoreductase (DUF2520 family)
MKPEIAVIGAGRVGTALALRLREKGYPVTAVASRSASSAQKLAEAAGAQAFADSAEAARKGKLVFITTPDGSIGAAAAEVAGAGGFGRGQFVAHASGALPARVLQPAKDAGAAVFSLHPLQSFASPELAVERLPGSYFTFEGDPEALPLVRELVADLGGSLFQIEAASKPLYHAAACVASNYLVTLMRLMYNLAEKSGLQRDAILPAFTPLIQGTLQNVGAVGPVAALTGPVVRGDAETIRQHAMAMVKEEWELYRLLGLHTVEIARERGLSPDAAKALDKIFCEVK